MAQAIVAGASGVYVAGITRMPYPGRLAKAPGTGTPFCSSTTRPAICSGVRQFGSENYDWDYGQ